MIALKIARRTITVSITIVSLFFLSNAHAFDYVIGTDKFNSTPPQPDQWASYVDPDTGITIRRITDIHKDYPEMPAGNGATIDYPRKTRLSSDGRHLLVYAPGASENSYQIVDLQMQTIRAAPHISNSVYDRNNGQDTQPEYRWDYSGNYPNRIYYRYGWEFYYGEVDYPEGQRTSENFNILLHDFKKDTEEFGDLASSIQNVYTDAEGDSSQDSRYWCWLVRLSDGTRKWVITYDKEQNTIIGKLTIPESGYGINFADMSPDGSRAIVSWNEYRIEHEPYRGVRSYNLAMDSTHMFCGASAHSGWSQDLNGEFKFVQANSCGNDYIRCLGLIDGSTSYQLNHQTYFADIDYLTGGGTDEQYLGHHIARTYGNVKGWAVISLYSSGSYWGCEQILAVEMKDIDDGIPPKMWRILSTQNLFGVNPPSPGGSTAPQVSLSLDGTKIYFGSNWRGTDNFEVYEAQLPDGWWDDLANQNTNPDNPGTSDDSISGNSGDGSGCFLSTVELD